MLGEISRRIDDPGTALRGVAQDIHNIRFVELLDAPNPEPKQPDSDVTETPSEAKAPANEAIAPSADVFVSPASVLEGER
ncbi:MAG TPA: hypothetical protein VJC10_03120 [Patescibacteria group bacterium]|nr:hypothetical protein [Patescibacteria group bacterium]